MLSCVIYKTVCGRISTIISLKCHAYSCNNYPTQVQSARKGIIQFKLSSITRPFDAGKSDKLAVDAMKRILAADSELTFFELYLLLGEPPLLMRHCPICRPADRSSTLVRLAGRLFFLSVGAHRSGKTWAKLRSRRPSKKLSHCGEWCSHQLWWLCHSSRDFSFNVILNSPIILITLLQKQTLEQASNWRFFYLYSFLNSRQNWTRSTSFYK